jgi:hypothetical protein
MMRFFPQISLFSIPVVHVAAEKKSAVLAAEGMFQFSKI